MFPSARRRLRLFRAAAPRRALLFHGARGRGLLRGPRPGPRVNPRTRDQEPSRACTRARARDWPHDDGAAANPFPALGLLGNARPGRPKAESTKGKEINSRGAGWRRIFEEGAGRSLYGSVRRLERFSVLFSSTFLWSAFPCTSTRCPLRLPCGLRRTPKSTLTQAEW